MTEVSNVPCLADESPWPKTARVDQQRAGLGLILAANGRLALDAEVDDFIRLTTQRKIDLHRMVVAEGGGQMLWAIVPIPSPGRTLLLLAPNHLVDPAQFEPAARLTDAMCRQYADCHLAQVLIDPAAAPARSLYARLGFMEVAELIYLHAPVGQAKAAPVLPENFYFEDYSGANHALFAQAIRESYRESLDCPSLNGLRDIEDVILGHQAAGGLGGIGEFDPRLWRVLVRRSATPRPCGVLLLCRTDHNQGMELVYIGLSPAARRQGLGTALVRQAFAAAAVDQRKRLTLAVDSRNVPALRLYYRHGFQKIASKVALIRDLRAAAIG